MKRISRISASVLSVFMLLNLIACNTASGNPTTTTSDKGKDETGSQTTAPAETEEHGLDMDNKPTLKILGMYQAYNYEEQHAYSLLSEITGYETDWYMLPAENADQKLLLDISNGEDYDLLIRMSQSGYSQLSKQNALIDLNDLLDKHGDAIKTAVSDLAWDSVTNADGTINAIPHEDMVASKEDRYGMLTGGIGLRSDLLEEIDLDVPTNLEDFTALLRTTKEKLGITPFAASAGIIFNASLMAAFDMGASEWYDVDGTYTHRIKMPKIAEYLEYMQMLYHEGLMDADMPINTGDNVMEKIANADAIAAPLMFWDIPAMVSALEVNNPDASIQFATEFSIDADTQPVKYIQQGAKNYTLITKNTKNQEYAMHFLNLITIPENFERIYVGEEGVSFSLEDGKYFPIFEGDDSVNFNAYTNSDKMTGPPDPALAFKMWQARARKTPEMAAAYEQMNARVDEYDVRYNIEAYGKSSPKVQEYNTALATAFSDAFLKAIVENTDAETAIAEMQAAWDAEGGLEMEAAMQEFYDANKQFSN